MNAIEGISAKDSSWSQVAATGTITGLRHRSTTAPRISFSRWIRLNSIRSTAAFAFLFAAMHLSLKA
ncbi:hypothetical protein OAA31_00310 [bacterium]|nr:hypothetical protein [bacterium]